MKQSEIIVLLRLWDVRRIHFILQLRLSYIYLIYGHFNLTKCSHKKLLYCIVWALKACCVEQRVLIICQMLIKTLLAPLIWHQVLSTFTYVCQQGKQTPHVLMQLRALNLKNGCFTGQRRLSGGLVRLLGCSPSGILVDKTVQRQCIWQRSYVIVLLFNGIRKSGHGGVVHGVECWLAAVK